VKKPPDPDLKPGGYGRRKTARWLLAGGLALLFWSLLALLIFGLAELQGRLL
jgi:hypothetical protein